MTLTEHSYFMPLSHQGVLQLEGEDAQSLLQNLLTNDVTTLALNQSQLTGLCNPKGRLLALFLLVRRNNAYQLVLPREMCAGLQQRLSMYILRSKVTIKDISDDMNCIGLMPSSNEDMSLLATDDLTLYPSKQTRFLYIASKDQTAEFVDQLKAKHWQLATAENWELQEIDDGLPMIYLDSKEKFTTQQVNLDLVNGVSFKKGCYPGQEIVARLHYLGAPSRRMFQAEARSATLANIGDEITTDSGDIAGHIVRTQFSNDTGLRLLVSLKLACLDATLFLNQTEITIFNKEISV